MAALRRLRRRPQRPSDDYSEPSDSSYNDNSNRTETSDDWQPETPDAVAPTKPQRSSRITRVVPSSSSSSPSPTVAVSRTSSHSPDGGKKSIRLTVKMPANKLREATNSSARSAAARRSHNIFTDDPIVSGPRNSRTKKRMVEIDTSDEENLDDEEEDEVDEDEDAEGEEDDDDVDADGDVDMDDVPPQPPVSKRQAKSAAPAGRGQVKSVEAKEMEMDDDDEDLSELDSDAEGELDDQELGGGAEDEELDDEEEEEEEEDDEDEDEEDIDPSKMTKRQRGSLGNDFLQLPMEPQIKKHLTAEEHAMRRAEMARRRKNLSEKRNEEEKMDTINRLLKKQAPKRRGRAAATEAEGTPTVQEASEPPKPDPTMVRWVSSANGLCRVAVPEELFGTPAGRLFGEAPSSNGQRKLVEEV